MGCGSHDAPVATSTDAAPEILPVINETTSQVHTVAAPSSNGEMFTDITDAVGLSFRHQTGDPTGYLLPVTMSGGAAIFDANNDGLLDIYFINAGDELLTSGKTNSATNALFLQNPDGTFHDATTSSGLGDNGYGMGCTVGDLDNDGDLDVYITNWGNDAIYRNNGDCTFTNVTAGSGITNNNLAISAAMFDYDRDGLLDLYVANYVLLDLNKTCYDKAGRPEFCGPKSFPGAPDRLYHNEGGFRFRNVSQESAIGSVGRAGLGVVCADFTDDGWPDVYVANDGEDNLLWINKHDGTFENLAYPFGAAVNRNGQPEASMGIALADINRDGMLDMLLTHLVNETNTLYLGRGPKIGFDDVTPAARLVAPSLNMTGFGTAFADVDHDGLPDLLVANGAVNRHLSPLTNQPAFWSDYAEPNQLFRNVGRGSFEDISAKAGAFTTPIEVSRALLAADFDRDGDMDILVTTLDGKPHLYRNNLATSDAGKAWLEVQPMLGAENRDAFGAHVTVVTNNERHVQVVAPSVGYASCTVAPLHFGMGHSDTYERIEIIWPDGSHETFPGGHTRESIELRQGAQQTAATP